MLLFIKQDVFIYYLILFHFAISSSTLNNKRLVNKILAKTQKGKFIETENKGNRDYLQMDVREI